MTLGELLTRAAHRRPEAVAVVDGTRRLSYAELDARRAAAARGFARLGVGKRDRVLIALRNRLEHVVAYWALQTLGGVPTPVNFRLVSGEMKYV
ncbi:MAG: 4-chlorobenzoate--CoA ligase, partial [Candidatus Rokuibacteriota bacterium]